MVNQTFVVFLGSPGILYLSLFKNKRNIVTLLFLKLEAFDCKVSFHRCTLTTVIVILHLRSTDVALPLVLAMNALPAHLWVRCHSGRAQYVLACLICDSWACGQRSCFLKLNLASYRSCIL